MSYVDAPETLGINDIARVSLRTADALPVDDYAVVIRAQVALAELGRAFQGFPGSLSGLGG